MSHASEISSSLGFGIGVCQIRLHCPADARSRPDALRKEAPDLSAHRQSVHHRRYPDVLSVKQVVRFTGYQSSSVIYWCKLNYLKAFSLERLYIPKAYLIEFLNSIHFRAINQKSIPPTGTTKETEKQIARPQLTKTREVM